ncbi:hypothetical protein [Actinocorallia herbida]|nr:hypothetical protein [Actinocorallia herbida]
MIRSTLLGGPEDPRWARPVLWVLAALAALLHFLGMGADPHPYYLIGTACAGASVFALYAAVGTRFGHGAGVLAGLALALSPVGIGRTSASDALALLLLILAAHAVAARGPILVRAACALVLGGAGVAVMEAEPWGFDTDLHGANLLAGAGSLADVPGGPFVWLLPFAAVSFAAGLAIARRDRARVAVLLLWGDWTAVSYLGYALGHSNGEAFTVLVPPGIAALAGIGAALMGRTGRPWPAVLSGCVLGTASVAFLVLGTEPDFQPWLRWTVAALACASAALMAGQRLACGSATLSGLLAGLAGPAVLALAAAGIIATG